MKMGRNAFLASLVDPELFISLFFGGLLAWGVVHQWGITLGITISWTSEVIYTSIFGFLLAFFTTLELVRSFLKKEHDRWEALTMTLFLLSGLISAAGIHIPVFAAVARVISAIAGTVLAGALLWYVGYIIYLTADDNF